MSDIKFIGTDKKIWFDKTLGVTKKEKEGAWVQEPAKIILIE